MNPQAPSDQAASLRALSAAMFRAVLAGAAVAGVPCVVVFGLLGGGAGALSALEAVLVGTVVALLTPALMRWTAAREPRTVMLASFGGSVQKLLILLVALFGLAAVPGAQRTALAVSALAVLIATAAAEGWAGYRLRTVAIHPATSGSADGAPDATDSAPHAPDGRPDAVPAPPERGA